MLYNEKDKIIYEINNSLYSYTYDEVKTNAFKFCDIVIINLEEDCDEEFAKKICKTYEKEANIAIITLDNFCDKLIQIASYIALTLRKKNITVICIYKNAFWDYEEQSISFLELFKKVGLFYKSFNTLILSMYYDYIDILELLFEVDKVDEGSINNNTSGALIDRYKNGGLSVYYSFYSEEEWDTIFFTENVLYHCIATFPFYLSKNVICRIIAGEKFRIDNSKQINDEKIIKGMIQDYLLAECRFETKTKLRNDSTPFGIGISFIFSGLDNRIFNEDGWDISQITDIPLRNRIERLYEGSIYVQMRRLEYESWIAPDSDIIFSYYE